MHWKLVQNECVHGALKCIVAVALDGCSSNHTKKHSFYFVKVWKDINMDCKCCELPHWTLSQKHSVFNRSEHMMYSFWLSQFLAVSRLHPQFTQHSHVCVCVCLRFSTQVVCAVWAHSKQHDHHAVRFNHINHHRIAAAHSVTLERSRSTDIKLRSLQFQTKNFFKKSPFQSRFIALYLSSNEHTTN